MTTGSYWDLTNPKKPVGELDVDEEIDIPWDWEEVCVDAANTTVASATLVPTEPVRVLTSTITNADLMVIGRIGVDPDLYDTDLHRNKKFGVTCHATLADGQKFDKTLWFKLVEH